MIVYRSRLDDVTLILRPQDSLDGTVLSRIEAALQDKVVISVQTGFHYPEQHITITSRPLTPKPEPMFINGVYCEHPTTL